MKKMANVVVIGGGTGTYEVLSGLKKYPVKLTAIITMMDSGGSTGKLRDQYGVLPPGDARQALVALAESPLVWRKLFLYRFENGDFQGHNFGNLFLSTLEKITGNFEKGLKLAQQVLQCQGEVVPITLSKTHINCELVDGTVLKTEALIDKKIKRPKIKRLFLNEPVPVNPKAIEALKKADLVVLAPGDVYTSLLPNFLFTKFIKAYQETKAKKVFVLNLMNKMGQTDNFSATDFLNTYTDYLGENPFDYILTNNAPFPKKIVDLYLQGGETLIMDDLTAENLKTCQLIKADLLNTHIFKGINGDILERSLIRHDGNKVAKIIYQNILSK